jgi:hypothetical protein
MKTKLIVILLLCFVLSAYSQEVQRKDITALRIDEHIKIDGQLDEAAYARAAVAKDFLQLMPYNGQPSYQPTEVRILYDDEALYFGAMLYDNPDSIANYITTRDNVGASDYFVVFIDPNNEGLLSYEFLVTPANSQTDLKGIRGSNGDNEDGSWNAVWQSQTRIVDNGWIVEMRIPYSALRFAAEEEPVWGLNFFRRIRRYNSNNSWNFINFNIQGFLHQSGQLHGLKNIQPPVRLSISPYVAQYVENKPGTSENDFVFKGGMDLKFGISESHTLDMMLIPDFGQIQSDDEELNLSPYELHYDEKRQFFNEGVELFSRADIFYSRRIGAKPIFSDRASENLGPDEEVTYNPGSTQMVNATKITGRDKNGWGIGFLNAMTLPAVAKIENQQTGEIRQVTTQPFTNYNISVIEKTLANNSYASIINTNLSMLNDPYSANVTATQFQLKDKKQNYQLTGIAGMSYKPTSEDKTGYGYHVQLDKIKGKFRFNTSRSLFSNTLDINDLGYMQRNNVVEHRAQMNYMIFEPFSIFKNWSAQVWWENERLYKPSANMQDQLKAWTDATFKNNWWLGMFYGYNFGTKDYFEPRSSDNSRFYHQPGFHMTELNLNSDQDKRLSFRLGNSLYFLNEPGRWGDFYYGRLWWKASQRFNITHNINMGHEFNAKGYVDKLDDANIYFGTYDRTTIENTTSLGYTFNTKIAIDCRIRHYWSYADYEDQQYFLNTDGSLTADPHQSAEDVNFNAFNIDMILKWEFAPGSELSLAWKNSIYDENKQVKLGFVENIKQTLRADQTNSFSLKLLYYIDYNSLFRSSL